MKIDYIPDGAPDCPLIRLSETTEDDIRNLLTIWGKLTAKEEVAIDLADVSSITSNDIHLFCKSGNRDIGLRQITSNSFDCVLRCETWLQVCGLSEPFLDDRTGFQWLDQTGRISLLLSPMGEW